MNFQAASIFRVKGRLAWISSGHFAGYLWFDRSTRASLSRRSTLGWLSHTLKQAGARANRAVNARSRRGESFCRLREIENSSVL